MSARTLLKNFISMSLLRVGLAALTFALFWFMSHRLSTAELGGFSLLMNTFFMVQALPLLGMTMPLMRRIASRPTEAASETSNAFCFAMPVGVAIGIGVACTGHLYAGAGLAWPFFLLGLSIVPSAWTVVAEAVLVGREEMQTIAYINLLESLGRLAGGWIAISTGAGLNGVFLIFLLLRCLTALSYLLNRHVPTPRRALIARDAIRPYFKEMPTYLSIALVTALCTRLDIILLSKLLSLRAAGIYAAAARLSDAALMVPTMAAVVVFPSQSRLFESDRGAFGTILERAVRWCLIAGFASALVVVMLAPRLIDQIYAANLAAAAIVLQHLILGAALMVVDQLLSTSMMAARSQQADLRSMILGLVGMVTFLVTFTHYFGLPGAALAIPSALLIRVLYRLHWAQRLFTRPMLGSALRIMAAAVGLFAVYFLQLSANELINLAAAYVVYGIILWFTRSVPADDWSMLRQWLTRSAGMRT